jgi:hypothetical protein
MIDYDPMVASDLTFYWANSYILVRDPAAGYLPATVRPGLSDSEWEDTNVTDLPDHVTVTLSVLSTERKNSIKEALGLEPGPERPNATVDVCPASLFERNERFITYRPAMGYLPMSRDDLLYVSTRATRNRFKGLSDRSLAVRSVCGMDAFSHLDVVYSLCLRLDEAYPMAALSDIRKAAAGEAAYAYLSTRCVVTEGEVHVAGETVARIDPDLNVSCASVFALKTIKSLIANAKKEQ